MVLSYTVLICLLLVVLVASGAEARGFWYYCDLSSEPVIQITKDSVTGMYKEVNGERNLASASIALRPLRSADRASSLEYQGAIPLLRQLEHDDETTDQKLYVRECTCSDDPMYCPVELQYCGIPRWDRTNQHPGCLNLEQRVVFCRNVWIYLVVWFGISFLLLMGTRWGRSGVVALLGNCMCCFAYNEWIADRMLENHPEQANYFIVRNLRRRRRYRLERRTARLDRRLQQHGLPITAVETLEQEETLPVANPVEEEVKTRPCHLALRTRRYKRDTEHGEEDGDEDEEVCAICFAPLESGERVGALPCNHDFHVSCLKDWLSRRNVCPLCQTANVAVLHYDEVDENALVENETVPEDTIPADSATPNEV